MTLKELQLNDYSHYYIDLDRVEHFTTSCKYYTNDIIQKSLVLFLNPDIAKMDLCKIQIIINTLLKYKIIVKNTCGNCDCKTNEDCKLKQQIGSVGCCDETEGQTQISNQ